MQHNARLDDLCKRLLAPFPLLLEEVKQLLNVTVAEERAATMSALAAKMPRRGDSLASLSSHTGGETGQPAALGATIQSVRPAPSAASDTLARMGVPELDASIKPATAVPASDRRPAIRLAPRAAAVRPSRPVTTPSSAAVATPGSVGVPAGLQQDYPATGEQQAIPVSPPSSPPASTAPATAPANRRGIPLTPRPLQQAAARLTNGIEPVLERAYRVTQAALSAPIPEPPAAQKRPIGQVHNTFNVAVSLNPSETAASVDREALQEALVELLRTAARRQGLEI